MKPPLGILAVLALSLGAFAEAPDAFYPPAEEQQLPRAMRSQMDELPTIRVGQHSGDLRGSDHRALQAAVDYIAALGGGVVEIGEGTYEMSDSLHLRSHVTIRGVPGKTVLRKAKAAVSSLALDGDYGEEQITLANPDGFAVGSGVAVWDSRSGGFHTTVARITGKRGRVFSIDKPLNADCMVSNGAQAATVFPVVSGYLLEDAVVEGLVIEGNKSENVHLNGCRGAGIFLYRGFGSIIRNCVVRNYNGDGISFQQSNDVQVIDCVSENNASLGIHPGSGSQRPEVRGCVARGNGEDGLFLCWRVRHGLFEDNVLEGNGRFGISIGHKDTDNLLRRNVVKSNHGDGVFFRNETLGMAGHRNRLEDNLIVDNGQSGNGAGIRIRGETRDLVLKDNVIRDTRAENPTQTVGVLIEENVGPVLLESNKIDSREAIRDRRGSN